MITTRPNITQSLGTKDELYYDDSCNASYVDDVSYEKSVIETELGDWFRPSVAKKTARPVKGFLADWQDRRGEDRLRRARQRIANRIAENEENKSLKLIRMEQGLSQAELADRIGTTQSVIARLESGKVDPKLSMILKLAHALNCDINTIGESINA